MEDMLQAFSVWALPALTAITLHEASHGYVADRLGDPTARLAGRLSLNPIRHVDPMGTVVLPALLLLLGAPFLFGWAKPVPVDPRRVTAMRSQRKAMAVIAAAGPGSNLVMALVAGLLFWPALSIGGTLGEWIVANLQNAVLFNVILAVFNLLPLPPLDGGRVAVGVLPRALARPLERVEPYGFMILLGFLVAVPMLFTVLDIGFNPVSAILFPPIEFVIDLISDITRAVTG